MEMIEAPMRARALAGIKVLENRRGGGTRAGDVTVRKYAGRYYPACTNHGAMSAVGGNIWRCLVTACNVGCEWHGS